MPYRAYRRRSGPGAHQLKLYGAVIMEVFGHLGFAPDDAAPMFEFTLTEPAEGVGLHDDPMD
jgi:hypothetical protein